MAKHDYWKPKEVAEYYRVSVDSVMRWIHRRQVGAVKLPSGRYLIPNEEVERIRNSVSVSHPSARQQAEEVKRREEEREARKQAALARLRLLSGGKTHNKSKNKNTKARKKT